MDARFNRIQKFLSKDRGPEGHVNKKPGLSVNSFLNYIQFNILQKNRKNSFIDVSSHYIFS